MLSNLMVVVFFPQDKLFFFLRFGEIQNKLETTCNTLSVSVFETTTDIYLDSSAALIFFLIIACIK